MYFPAPNSRYRTIATVPHIPLCLHEFASLAAEDLDPVGRGRGPTGFSAMPRNY
jgi:hypothetical protein